MQQHLMRYRQEYGLLISSGRVSPRVVQIDSMLLPLDDAQPPLAPLVEAPEEHIGMRDHDDAIMRELSAKHDEVAELSVQKSSQYRTMQLAEAHIRTVESQLHVEAQQRDLAVPMAREVGAQKIRTDGAGRSFMLCRCERRQASGNP